MEKHLGKVMDSEAIDCLMTTICTDRPLPAPFDDYGRQPNQTLSSPEGNQETNVFQRIIDYVSISWNSAFWLRDTEMSMFFLTFFKYVRKYAIYAQYNIAGQ
jgi:hypothetical protein